MGLCGVPCVFLDRFSYLQQRDQRRGESRLFCTLWVLVPSDEGFLDGPHFLLRQMIAPLDLSPDNAFEALHCTSARPRTSHLINQSNRDLTMWRPPLGGLRLWALAAVWKP